MNAAPGWYRDPWIPTHERWWTGRDWAPYERLARRRQSEWWKWLLAFLFAPIVLVVLPFIPRRYWR